MEKARKRTIAAQRSAKGENRESTRKRKRKRKTTRERERTVRLSDHRVTVLAAQRSGSTVGADEPLQRGGGTVETK